MKFQRIFKIWVDSCTGLVAGIVLLGGLTRLTRSGLSMVDWNFMHFLPPNTEAEWDSYFKKYKEFPEYNKRNFNMTLEEYKWIYFCEHWHRVYGRLLGIYIFIPSILFLSKQFLSKNTKGQIILLNGLMLIQGFIGWYMVKSGLESNDQNPRVSHIRLTIHLGIAASIFSILSHISSTYNLPRIMKAHSILNFNVFLSFLTLLSGALVAGTDAGKLYGTFPKMGINWIPDDYKAHENFFANILYSPSAIQFNHRLLAFLLLATSIRCVSSPLLTNSSAKKWILLNLLAVSSQAFLGIMNIFLHVPKPLALFHQAGSLGVLFTAIRARNKSVIRF